MRPFLLSLKNKNPQQTPSLLSSTPMVPMYIIQFVQGQSSGPPRRLDLGRREQARLNHEGTKAKALGPSAKKAQNFDILS